MGYNVNLPVLAFAVLVALVLAAVRAVRCLLRRRERLEKRNLRAAAEREVGA